MGSMQAPGSKRKPREKNKKPKRERKRREVGKNSKLETVVENKSPCIYGRL